MGAVAGGVSPCRRVPVWQGDGSRRAGAVQERCWPVGPGGGPEGPPEDRTGLKGARLRAPGMGGVPPLTVIQLLSEEDSEVNLRYRNIF